MSSRAFLLAASARPKLEFAISP